MFVTFRQVKVITDFTENRKLINFLLSKLINLNEDCKHFNKYDIDLKYQIVYNLLIYLLFCVYNTRNCQSECFRVRLRDLRG